ncbi:MAG: GNAT family N-acetyltransferase [Chloroflexi bacterium]|nr:GNAT family N-acetyltransferase [Chloroflexota bacterium]
MTTHRESTSDVPAVIRPTLLDDIPSIAALIAANRFRSDGSGALLPVSPQQILRMLGDEDLGRFFTAVAPSGEVVGCVSVAVYGMPSNHQEVIAWLANRLPADDFGIQHDANDDLGQMAELRSLAVSDAFRGRQLGLQLIETAKAEARSRGFGQLYSLVNRDVVGLFERAGFCRATRPPAKLIIDCAVCPLLDHCVEIPVVAEVIRSRT